MANVSVLSDNNLHFKAKALKVIAIIISELNLVLFLAVFGDSFYSDEILALPMLGLVRVTAKVVSGEREHYVVVNYGEICIIWRH